MAIFAWGTPNLKEIKSFDQRFATINHSPNSIFVPGLSKIGDLNCNTSYMVLSNILMDTTYLEVSSHSSALAERSFRKLIDKHVEALNSL